MSWLSRSTPKRACGLTRQWYTLPSSLGASSSLKSLLAHQHPTSRAVSSSPTGKRPVNDQIPFKFVRIADPETGGLRPPTSLKTILNSIDCKTHHVELVAGAPDPIVKIVDTRQAREKYKEMKKQAQATARAQARKEIQVSWSVAEGDLAHKLGKARQELSGGKKVDLVFISRPGQERPTKQMMYTRVEGALNALADVGKEWLPRGARRDATILFLKPLGGS